MTEPMIYTLLGNVEESKLNFNTVWEDHIEVIDGIKTGHIVCALEWRLKDTDELVKRAAHIYSFDATQTNCLI